MARARTRSRSKSRTKPRRTGRRSAPTRRKRVVSRKRPAARRSKRPAQRRAATRGSRSRRAPRVAAPLDAARRPAAVMAREPETTPELDFEMRDGRGRIGDTRSARRQLEEFPPSRVREAGLTGGESPGQRDGITPDDASPETLLDNETLDGIQTPAEQRVVPAADSTLSVVDGSMIGAGGNTDEAEDARRHPIAKTELRRIRRRVARAASSLNDMEPAESAAGSPGRERNAPPDDDAPGGQGKAS